MFQPTDPQVIRILDRLLDALLDAGEAARQLCAKREALQAGVPDKAENEAPNKDVREVKE